MYSYLITIQVNTAVNISFLSKEATNSTPSASVRLCNKILKTHNTFNINTISSAVQKL